MTKNTTKRPVWTGLSGATPGPLALMLVVATLALVLFQGGVKAAGTFNPVVNVELSDYSCGANADVTTSFSLPGTDYNYKELVSFTPQDFFVAAESDAPIGAEVGELDYLATVGLVNGACNTPLSPGFTLLNCSTDTEDTVSFDEQFDDVDPANSIHDGCDRYPDFLKRILPGITPRARLYGDTMVSGRQVSINVVILEPGSLGYPAAWGYPSLTVLNDMGDPAAVPAQGEAITDFCTPRWEDDVIYGLSEDNPETGADEAGYEVRRNPAYGGTYTFRWHVESYRDADGDGIENPLDTCPFDANEDASPKLPGTASDPDGDGIDSACDPDPAVPCWTGAPGPMANDCDLDGFYNRGDNCPLIANGPVEEAPPQKDTDADDIGDVCDLVGEGGIGQGPDTPDGDPIVVTPEEEVDIVCAPPPPPPPPPSPTSTPTPTGTPTPTPSTTPTSVPEVTEYCSPVFPGTYNGLVRIDGQPAASGYEVTASIDGVQWGSALVSGGRYAVDIPDHLPTEPPCFEGGTITFALDGMACTPTADWASGINNVDLSCAPAAPVTPTPAVTPTVTPAVTPTPKATPTTVPPTGAGGLSGSSPRLPLWTTALASWAGLMIVAGLGTLMAARRR
jgi:hypothetical protein